MTDLEEPRTPGAPVIKRTAIGQYFVGALVNIKQRDVQKRDDEGNIRPVLKSDGRYKQELVLTLLTMPGTTAPAGIGDQVSVPTPGDKVRLILRGQAFGQWIEAKKVLHGKVQTGDIVTQTTEYGQAYDAFGKPIGRPLTLQEDINVLPRQTTIGIYGTITLRHHNPNDPDERTWAQKADVAHHADRQQTPLEPHINEDSIV